VNEPIGRRQKLDLGKMLAEAKATTDTAGRHPLLWAGSAIAALLLAAAFWSSGSSTGDIRYTTQPAARGSLMVVVTATGSVQPINQVDVSSELSGTVRKVHVDFNSTVTAGQTLAELDTDKLLATLGSSRAKVEAAKAKVTDAEASVIEKQRDLMRKRALAAKHFTSTHDLEVAQAAYDRSEAALVSTRADVGVAMADLTINETNLAKATITSPIKGVVLQRNVDPGQTVAASLQAPVLFVIAEDLRQMELQVNVDEADVGSVRPAQPASFTVDAYPDRKFPATIRDVRYASETVQGVVTYKAVLNVDNAELLLRPGMTATAEIRALEITDALLVPNAALRYAPPSGASDPQPSFLRRLLPGRPSFRPASKRQATGPDRTVYTLRDGAPVAIGVRTGASDGKSTEIVGGELKAGDAVILGQSKSK
jgi:HlyD family secretion protein